ncbi:MAG: hypothetical protein JSW40_03565 [Candidatus Omnitrophota bacterium]|nr:MAG: hypothetical protein JSW40_03565 [Candidatus Omnitrophota bacterium]
MRRFTPIHKLFEDPVENSPMQKWLIVIFILSITIAAVYLVVPKAFTEGGDPYYLVMVQGSPNDVPAQWAYRIMVPALVKVLPFSPKIGFFIVTYGATLLLLLAMFQLLTELKISYWSSIVTVQLLCFSFSIAHYLSVWGMVDPLANFFIVYALIYIIRKEYAFASCIISLGCLAKETTLFLLPLLFWNILKDKKGHNQLSTVQTIFIFIVPLSIWFLLRMAVIPTWDIQNIGFFREAWRDIWMHNTKDYGLLLRIAREVTRTYGFLWISAFLGFRFQRERKLESLYFVIVGIALCLVARSWTRMISWGFVGIFIPSAIFIDKVRQLKSPPYILASLVILALLQCWLSQIGYERLPQFEQGLLVAGILSVFCIGAMICVFAYRKIVNMDAVEDAR